MIRRLAVLFLLSAASLGAQVSETVTVSVVEIPVTVTGRDGNPIRGLTRANFEVLDEGKKQPITSFDTIDFASAQSLSAVSPLNPAARRNFLLLFDLSFSSPNALVRSQKAAREFLNRMVQKRDRVAIATIGAEKGFRLLTAFTTDRSLLTAAISNPQTFRGNDPLQLAGVLPIAEEKTEAAAGAGERPVGMGQTEMNEAIGRAKASDAQFNKQRVERQVSLLGGLANTLGSVNGQKHLVLLSEGFEARHLQGREAASSAEQRAENTAVESGEVWNVDTDQRYGSATGMSMLDKMARAFRASDVILHAMDIAGLRVDNTVQEGLSRKSNEGLFLLANSTGGTVFKNTNDLASDFSRFARQQEVVYVLGFQAPSTVPGKLHNLKVRVVNVPGAKVVHRSAYREAGGGSPVERTLTTAEIVMNDIPQQDLPVAALAAPFATAGPNHQVPVILEIDGGSILRSAKGNAATTEIFVYAFDEEGVVRDSLVQRMSLDLGKVGQSLRSGGIKYYGTLSLPPGKYAVRSLVRVAESDRKGFVRVDVVVPKAGEVAVSKPFFFEEPGKWVMVKGGSHDATNSGYPFEVNGQSFIPRAAVRLKSGTPQKFAVVVSGANPEQLTWEVDPKAKLLGQYKTPWGAKLLFQIDDLQPNVANVNVVVKLKGEERRTSVPVVMQ